ncbi:hypothetical protein K1T71_006263 [Dendrolimus kikuchii]|uniref:Uncharacterized protein n=1 Tax=Dendrolimus kikuchii TaxID=765133 RepID=A0ACC1D3J0_9NEOP|nr:hypothetical protein K1T71_006263 [Dendrolimus kikuchii]
MSTQDAILDLTSTITEEIDKGNKCLVAFLDLKKAFDTVSIPLLIRRLERIGFQAITSLDSDSWIQSINEELQAHEQNGTWELVEKPSDIKVIGYVRSYYTTNKTRRTHEMRPFRPHSVLGPAYLLVSFAVSINLHVFRS